MGAISFVQAPGPNNVLGKVKFVYPNPYTVYMHDTIKVGLFDTDMRAEGHNCPRVFKPGKIAAVVLAADQNMPQAQVDKLLADGYNSAVNIQHHLPVHTTYFTATVDDEGKLQTYADIYKLDGVVAAAIVGKEAKADAVADNAPAKAKPPKPDGASPTRPAEPRETSHKPDPCIPLNNRGLTRVLLLGSAPSRPLQGRILARAVAIHRRDQLTKARATAGGQGRGRSDRGPQGQGRASRRHHHLCAPAEPAWRLAPSAAPARRQPLLISPTHRCIYQARTAGARRRVPVPTLTAMRRRQTAAPRPARCAAPRTAKSSPRCETNSAPFTTTNRPSRRNTVAAGPMRRAPASGKHDVAKCGVRRARAERCRST